ncbi:junctional sarcoplasmic reticulum protein 1 isoform X2 [Cygnus atratus]|nr:junctional sarcoplasmic reticulum protein 1 isoform X2 [Cygnus atratus]XP_035425583.1 junctional sarcoplasmic reticulum protein 1 isoform X2 [Cygnus atratus]XP_035425584.1 junctional sarcoplasmic reticulum protein 1 isoform X2 [Cygnus atratus]
MPEPAPLSADKRAAEKKRAEKVGAKGSTAVPAVPKSLPVKTKVEPHSLDPAEEPLIWEGLTLNKCILVASIVALLSVSFQVLQAPPCSRDGVSSSRQEPPAPPIPEVTVTKEEAPEVEAPQPVQPESSMLEDDDSDDDGDDDDNNDADSNLAEPWIFKKWFGRSEPKDEEEEPAEEPEEPPAKVEVRKGREKPRAPEKKEEKAKDSRTAPAERSGRQDPRPKDRTTEDKPIRAPRAPKEPEQQPHKKRGREGKESRRERDEPRRDGGKSRPSRAERQEGTRRDWRQPRGEQRGKKPWEQVGKDGTDRPREGRRRD